MQIEDLPIPDFRHLTTDAQLHLILDVRQRRRVVVKPQRSERRVTTPKIDKLSNDQLQRLAQLLGLETA